MLLAAVGKIDITIIDDHTFSFTCLLVTQCTSHMSSSYKPVAILEAILAQDVICLKPTLPSPHAKTLV